MSRIYVGNLPTDIRERELEDIFYKYGRIRDIQVKTPQRPPAFAFITFEDSRDAEDAVRGRDGYNFDGSRLRVEFANSDRGGGGGDRDDRGGRSGDRDRGGRGDRDRPAPSHGKGITGKRANFGVLISGLPRSCSWQDLKDFGRKAGDVVFADTDRNGEGIIDFSNDADMRNAMRVLADEEFKNRFDKSVVTIRYANPDHGGGGGSKRSASRSRSRDRRGASRSGSRDRSPSRSRSRSPARRDDK